MSIVSVSEQFQPDRYLIVSLRTEEGTITTTNIVVSDLRTNTVNLVSIEKGPQGEVGPVGPQGPAGKDGLTFTVLPLASGGTSNTVFNSGFLLTSDGNQLLSSTYSIQDIIDLASANTNAITGIIPGTGLQKINGVNNTVLLDVKIGEGLTVSNNQIVVDNTIARTAELNLGEIQGTVPLSKGGTNNDTYNLNQLIYYNGTKLTSFPLNTGTIVVSGSAITIEAGSGLVGGGNVVVPSGSILLQIGASADILVEENSISLSNTGLPGTYTKVTTDSKGRVTSGTNLTTADILGILGYVPWHPGNDGEGSGLDADLLDGQHASFFTNASNLSGTISAERLPDLHENSQIGTKFRINTKGLIDGVYYASYQDIIDSLGFRPVSAAGGDRIDGSLTVAGSFAVSGGETTIYDNLPLFGANSPNILPSEPRGFTFRYGATTSNRTGILAYYPTDNQLRLITNIYGSGAVPEFDGNENEFQDDINGGNASTIYITENLDGERSTVLFREIADQLYINTNQVQSIDALKRFLGGINVVGQIKFLSDGFPNTIPPFDIGSNNLKVVNLNADLLDDQDGSYYRNASNITGSFDYNNVSFDHIEGIHNYIPKFNDTSEPSRRIDSSNIKQRTQGDIEITNDVNLVVGEDNDIMAGSMSNIVAGLSNSVESENAIVVGFDNQVYGTEAGAIGSKNIASGDNSLALNYGSTTLANNSVAMGSYGLSTLENQISFGAFRTTTGNTILEHGQYSTVAAYLRGVETYGTWRSLTPIIQLPQDKTITYNIELLINKGLSSGVAHFTFSSGIINNATYRDPNNIANIINSTTVPSSGYKTESYNNSQLRRHSHRWTFRDYSITQTEDSDVNKTQFVWAKHPPAQNNNIDIRYLYGNYFYEPKKIRIDGTFLKSHDGSLLLDVGRPRYNENFYQAPNSTSYRVETDDSHQATLNCLVDLQFTSGQIHLPPSGRYSVNGIINAKTFSVQGPTWTAVKYSTNNGTRLVVNAPSGYDNHFVIDTSGTISNTILTLTNDVNSNHYNIFSILKTDHIIRLSYEDPETHIVYNYNRLITGINASNNEVYLNAAIKTDAIFPTTIFGNVGVSVDNFSTYLFRVCDKISVDGESVNISGAKESYSPLFDNRNLVSLVSDGGAGDVNNPLPATLLNPQNSGIYYDKDVYENNSFHIIVSSRIDRLTDGSIIQIAPLFNNQYGDVNMYSRTNLDCTYISQPSNTNIHSGVYVRYLSGNNQEIRIFDTNFKPLDFISQPFSFSLVDGPLSEHNNKFAIKQFNNRYFLYTKDDIDYESYPALPVRIKCSPSDSRFASDHEQVLYVYLNNINESPLVSQNLDPLSITTDNLLVYQIPHNLFVDPENDSLSYSAEIKSEQPLPRWLVFDSDTLTLSGTPDQCDIGLYNIDIIANDSLGLYAKTTLIIEVSANQILALEGFAQDETERLEINNIFLDNNRVNENSANTLIGELKSNDGYNPYVFFGNGSNSMSGIFIENSNLVRHIEPTRRNITGVIHLSGSPSYLGIGTTVSAQSLGNISSPDIGLSSGTVVTNVYKPTVFSGTPISGNKIIFDNIYQSYRDTAIFTGQYLGENNITENFGIDIRAKYIDDFSITVAQSLIQESHGLIMTEDNSTLEHEYELPKITFYIERENNDYDLLIEDEGSTEPQYILHDDTHGFKAVSWSRKPTYSNLYTEKLDEILVSEEDRLITDNISNFEIIYEAPTLLDVNLMTENSDILIDELSLEPLNAKIIDERIWFSSFPNRISRVMREGIDLSLYNETLTHSLQKLNVPDIDTEEGFSISNIDYPRSDLFNVEDVWTFLEPINNAVLYLHSIGSDDTATLITDDRNHSGNFTLSEYGLLSTEDNIGLILESDKFNGSRIELSNRYEIIDSVRVYADNGRVHSEDLLSSLICENYDTIVHDYAILANSGDTHILFPGIINDQIKLKYPTAISYSSARVGDGSLGYYEDNPTLIPEALKFSEPNFYFTWGKLIGYRLYTDEYAVRLSSIYDNTTTSGLLVYNGTKPDDGNYFPEQSLSNNRVLLTGDCPQASNQNDYNGMLVLDDMVGAQYVTGIATFYTSYAVNTLTVTSSKDFNKDLRIDDYVYLYNPSSNNNNALLPRVGTYSEILSATSDSITVDNYFLYPSTKTIAHNGNISLNLDRNHQQIIKSSDYRNRIPIKFNSVFNTSSARLPKNNLFDIKQISGQIISTEDKQNYLLRPDNYFDGVVSGHYLTNGISFFGSTFNDNVNIYDVRRKPSELLPIYNNITFEYRKDLNQLSVNIPSGIVSAFDNVRLDNFKPLSPFMVWDNKTYVTGFKILPENLSARNIDDTPDKDFILMERSASILQPDNYERLTFYTNIFANSASGTCTLSNLLQDRIEPGYILNFDNNTKANTPGIEYINHQPGYSFSGSIPRFHNIISTTGIVNDSRIGYSSVFNTGNNVLLNGNRTIRQASMQDIGFTELYHTKSTGFIGHTYNRPYDNLKGIGSIDRWYISDTINTSGSNKQLEFVYLGHNDNSVKIFGSLNSPSTNNLTIKHIPLSTKLFLDKLLELGESSGVEPVLSTGTNGADREFTFDINVTRFDSIVVDLEASNNTTGFLQLNIYANDPAEPAAFIVDQVSYTGDFVYPTPNTYNMFYVLPTFITDTKYCSTTLAYNKNDHIYYNGNLIFIDHLSSINSYVLYNDQLKIINLNNSSISGNFCRHIQKINATNQTTTITGISLDGDLSIPSSVYPYRYTNFRENETRYSLPFGTGRRFLPNTGYISFIPSYSGTFELINYNNIYFQSYGGYTARWPQDTNANLTSPPLTGTYRIVDDVDTCSSGKLCVIISGYLGSSLNSILKNESYYFDFDNLADNLSNVYNVVDKLNNNAVSINPDYNVNYIGQSGLVYIIDSAFNLKSHLNPNIDNVFISNSPTASKNTGLIDTQIHYFDHDTKKWTHLYHFVDNPSTYSGYDLRFNNEDSRLIFNTKDTIGITNIAQYNESLDSFIDVSNNFYVYSNTVVDILKISTTGGSPKLFGGTLNQLPKIYISGLTSYQTITAEGLDSLYGYTPGSGWDIGIAITPYTKTGIYPLKIIARDETGESSININMIVKDKPQVTVTYPTGYFTVSDTQWFMSFDTKGLDLLNDFPGNQGIFVSGTPNDLSYDIDIRNSSTISIQGFRAAGGGGSIPFNTGIWHPVIKFMDVNNGGTIVEGTGILYIVNNLNDRPPYVPYINKLQNHYYVNIAQSEVLSFYIPAYENIGVAPTLNLNIPGINTVRSVGWDIDTNRYIATIIPRNTGDSSYLTETKYNPNNSFQYSISQNEYVDGTPSVVSYNSDTYNFALTFYRPIFSNHQYNPTINSIFDINEPWKFEFALQEGATKHRPDQAPRVKVYNTPSIGDNTNVDLSYKVRYRYNADNQFWVVFLEGRPDIYGRYAQNTGVYNISYVADDGVTSVTSGNFNITYIHKKNINYIQSEIYTTPNNEYFINADIIDNASGIKTLNEITFDGENSLYIDPDKSNMVFDNNLNIWEYYATGNKLIDKWDARLLINTSSSPSLTLQCKGIATDKITAIAKVNLLELQNNNVELVEGLPIKITGIKGGNPQIPWTQESGIVVQQGDKWEVSFKTILGLESSQNPPTIFLSGTPTNCSGYDPRLDPLYNDTLPPESQLYKCVVQPSFDESEKAWNFKFSGDPSCLLLGELDFSIIAIDTDLSNDPIYIEPADTVNTLFTYIPITEPHPDPEIVAGSADEFDIQTNIEPNCAPYFNAFKFGPKAREKCPIPTGLTGIITSGSLPSGLTFTINYPGIEGNLFNAPIYDNLNSGTLTIQGTVTGYPPEDSSQYDEIFYLTVIDARGNSATQEITFSTSINPIDPNIYFRVYFENDEQIFSPATGTELVKLQTANIRQPDASVLETICGSVIPDNNTCTKFPVIYSGVIGNSTDYVVLHPYSGYETEHGTLGQDSLIYFNMLSENTYDQNYYVKIASSLLGLPAHIEQGHKYINTSSSIPSNIATGIAEIIVAKNDTKNLNDLSTVFGGEDVNLVSQGCVLGNGRIGTNEQGQYGILGYLSAAFSGYIPNGGYYAPNDTFGSGLVYNTIDNTSKYAEIAYNFCQETGYVRFSGIILPPIYIEITDPPPLANKAYGDDGTTFSLNSRLAYGNSIVERNKPLNARAGSAYYTVTNILTDNIIQSGTINITTESSAPILLTASTLAASAAGSGTNFRLDYICEGGEFPSSSHSTLPTAIPSVYAWVHKAGLLGDIPSESSFPPVCPIIPQSMNIVSGQLINYDEINNLFGVEGLAIGGYIPTDICINNICPDGYTNYPYLLAISGNNNSIWSSSDYLPTISGIILEDVSSDSVVTDASVTSFPLSILINNESSILTSGQKVTFTIYRNSAGSSVYNIFTTGLTVDSFDENGDIPYVPPILTPGISDSTIKVEAMILSYITDIDNNVMTISHYGYDNYLSINDVVILDKVSSSINRVSSAVNNLTYTQSVLSVSDISTTGLTLTATGGANASGLYTNFGIEDIVDVYIHIEDNIKIMPTNISSNNEGNFNFLISGRANILYGQYLYRILTKENPSAPIFTLGWSPKTYYKDIDLYVGKPLEIVSSNVSWGAGSTSWTVTLQVYGGTYPGLSEKMKVKIDRTGTQDWTYCGFNRYPVGVQNDSYDPETNITTITLSSSNVVSWSPSSISTFDILVYDSSGNDTITINRQQ